MNIRYCILTFLLTSLLPHAGVAQSFIVRLDDDAPASLVAALEEGGRAKRNVAAELFDGVGGISAFFRDDGFQKHGLVPFRAFTVHVANATVQDDLMRSWAAQPGVAYVQENHRYLLDAVPGIDDPLLDSLAHLPVIRAFEAWAITTGSRDVRVGLVDTGLFFEHPDLGEQVWINPGEDANGNGVADAADVNGEDDDGNGFVDDLYGYDFVDRAWSVEQGDYRVPDPDPSEDDQMGGGRGHGTLVAGVLAAAQDNGAGISGVAPGVRLVPLRAFGADGIGEDDDVAAAIVYAAQMGLDVVNLSFGDVYYSRIMREAIQFAVAQGTVVVASAGNLGGDDPHYPSDFPEVISAAWLAEDGRSIAGRGAFGVGIDVGAPGSFVYTTLMPRFDEDGGFDPAELYGRRSGSSLAAPMVAGTAALLRSIDPNLTPAAIQSILTATARDLRDPGWDHQTGAGLLDAAAALERALPARVALTYPDHDGGWAGQRLPIVGSVADPAFESFSVFVAEGDEDLGDDWQQIAGPFGEQMLDDTLAVWDVRAVPDGVYTLRLAATLRTGRTVEDRRRVFLDRTPPLLTTPILNEALVDGMHGITVDLETDDLTDAELRVTVDGANWTVVSDRRTRRHGLTWMDETGRGGPAHVEVRATNRAGLVAANSMTFTIPARSPNTALFMDERLTVPHGYLLPFATDFDADGLLEIVLNRYQEGWIGDTLAVYEWDGNDFAPAEKLVANVIPRDVADTDGDGLLEMLTQVGGATLVLEQRPGAPYPFETSFIDTTGLSNPFDPNAAFGARLSDLDADGRGEVLVHNTRQWRLLEYAGGSYADVLLLENPTGVVDAEVSENEFQQPLVLIDDFDGDGRQDLLTGDSDGDWIMYEAMGDDQMATVWSYETRRYSAGARFGKGDFDGDGLPEFVTYTQNWTQPTHDGQREPDVGLYYVWDNVADNTYALVDSLAVPGVLSRHGSLTAADFDGDGLDELVLVDPPGLHVFGFNAAMQRTLLFHQGAIKGASQPGGFRSVAMVAADFDGDGRPELLAGGADEQLHRLVYNAPALAHPPPVWEAAVALDERAVSLTWRPLGADSVTVFRGVPGAPLDPIRTTRATTIVDSTMHAVRYVLRGWRDGLPSLVSQERLIVPRAPAVVQAIQYPDATTVELLFSEPLQPGLRPLQFALDAGRAPDAVILGRSNHAIIVRFAVVSAREDTLRWTGVHDAVGRPVGQTVAAVSFPEAPEATLHLTTWSVERPSQVMLIFNVPLDPTFASDVSNYSIRPAGRVVAARWEPGTPERVVVEVAGRAIGATGLETSLEVTRMQGAAGEQLAPEGHTVSLTQAAADLSGVYVFPNPFQATRHQERVMVAGLPPEADIVILSVQGEVVRRLEERSGTGGIAWNLRDEDGRPVPSGVYLVRVEAPDQEAVLRKAAIIR